MPVFNGENFVAGAIDSILAQTFGDLELIVSDNASTDATEEIVRRYAAADPRVSYHRNERNLGAAPNYNRTFAMAGGEYFKWAAHDDLLARTFLRECVDVLDGNASAVLCHCLVEYIDSDGASLGTFDSRLVGADADRASTRFAAMALRPHPCNEFFGLARRSALEGSLLHGNYHGTDRALLAQLALRGRILVIRKPLIKMRTHPARYSECARTPGARRAWHNAACEGQVGLPSWRLYRDYWRVVAQELSGSRERTRCYGHLIRWWTVNWNWARAVVDVVAVMVPGAVDWAERVKQRVFSPAPGPARAEPGRHVSREDTSA